MARIAMLLFPVLLACIALALRAVASAAECGKRRAHAQPRERRDSTDLGFRVAG